MMSLVHPSSTGSASKSKRNALMVSYVFAVVAFLVSVSYHANYVVMDKRWDRIGGYIRSLMYHILCGIPLDVAGTELMRSIFHLGIHQCLRK